MAQSQPKKILCFGDSNTWGFVPYSGQEQQRFPQHQRWPGILQSQNPGTIIIEEGLNSRTTNVDDPDQEGKNGLTALPSILTQHCPLDMMILMLGTNDLKQKFSRTPEQIAEGIQALVTCALQFGVKDLVLVAPPIPILAFAYEAYVYPDLEAKALQLAKLYQQIAETQGLKFLNAAEVIQSSKIDGIHLSPESHQRLAQALTSFFA